MLCQNGQPPTTKQLRSELSAGMTTDSVSEAFFSLQKERVIFSF